MPNSNSAVRIIDPVLTNVAQGYNTLEAVGSTLFPRVPVRVRGGQIIEFGREAFRLYQTKRAPGSKTARIQFGYLGKPFALLNDAIECPVPREHMQDAAIMPGIDLGRRAINVGMRSSVMSLEVEQATLATTLGNYGAGNRVTLAGVTKWSYTTTPVNPLTDVDTGREAIRQACGMYPNVAVMSALAFNACKNNANVVARFQYNGAAGTDASQITPNMLAGLLNLDKVVVGKGVYFNDAGTSTDIWGNNVVLAYVPVGDQSIEEPSYGYTYTLDGNPLVEEPYWEPQTKSWVYGVTYERAPVLSGIAAGYLIQNPA
jgi:hypothetical protein